MSEFIELQTMASDLHLNQRVGITTMKRVVTVTKIGGDSRDGKWADPELIRVQDESIDIESGKAEHWFQAKYLLPLNAAA